MIKRKSVPVDEEPTIEPLAYAQALVNLREHQLTALRAAMTLPLWAAVCEALPEARAWFDDEGRLR